MKLIIRWVINALLLLLVATIIPDIAFANFYSALITVVILGLINALIRPILLVFTLPINILTLGLFTLIINALMFWLASTVVRGFDVAGFWPAFWGALLYSVFTMIVGLIDPKN